MKLFISGKITGEPIHDCIWKFEEVENDVNKGWISLGIKIKDVVNPLYIAGVHFGISHEEAMRICFEELETCDAIYMLSDWKESKGARMEHEKAKELGIKIYYQEYCKSVR